MRNILLFSTSALLFALLCSTPALSDTGIVIGESCTNLGVSTMTSDQKNIAVCLKDDDGDLIWKASTSGSGSSPTGTIAFFALASCPSGWALANGSNGTLDLRGEFLRVADSGRGVDAGRVAGSAQGDAIRNITGHIGNAIASGLAAYPFSSSGALYGQVQTVNGCDPSMHGPDFYNFYFDASRIVPTANENRPRNIALIACQKI